MLPDVLKNPIIRDDMERIYNSDLPWESMDGKNIYITGAAGMIASYVVFFLIYLNETRGFNINIYACVRNHGKAVSRFGRYMEREYFHTIEADVCDSLPFDIRFDYIIHAASLASPQYYGCRPVDVMIPNLIGTHHLLEYARIYGCESFVFFSSGSVYGTLGTCESVREDMYGTMDYLALGNCYGESKRCGEALTRAYSAQYGINTHSVRIFHTYGPTMDINNDKRVFAEFVRSAVRGEDIVIKSDGTASRAFCYLSDTVAGIFSVITKGEAGSCYNIGNPHEYMSIMQLAGLVASLSDNGIKVVRKKRMEDDAYLPSPEQRKAALNIERIQKLGWEPRIDGRTGFGKCIKYLAAQEGI